MFVLVCLYTHVHACAHELRGQLCGVSSHISPLCGNQTQVTSLPSKDLIHGAILLVLKDFRSDF